MIAPEHLNEEVDGMDNARQSKNLLENGQGIGWIRKELQLQVVQRYLLFCPSVATIGNMSW